MFVRTLPLDKDSSVTDRTSEFFDRYAGGFNAIYGNANGPFESIVNRLFRQAMVKRYEKTLAGCQPIEGRTVIDVGCGPGHYGVALASAGAAHVLGLDFAPGMLTLAEQAAKARRVAERCTFVLGDFLTYPIPERFDYVIVMGFMDYVRDPGPVIDRVLEIMKSRAFFSFPKDGNSSRSMSKRCRYALSAPNSIRSVSRRPIWFSMSRMIGRSRSMSLGGTTR